MTQLEQEDARQVLRERVRWRLRDRRGPRNTSGRGVSVEAKRRALEAIENQ